VLVDGDQAERFPIAVKQQALLSSSKSYRRIIAAMEKVSEHNLACCLREGLSLKGEE
jgi:hypothetical protein